MRHYVEHHLVRFFHSQRSEAGHIVDGAVNIFFDEALGAADGVILDGQHCAQYGRGYAAANL